jgi:hypothetical protein
LYAVNLINKKSMFLNIYSCSDNVCENETFELKTDNDCRKIEDEDIYNICLSLIYKNKEMCNQNIYKNQCIVLHAIKNNDEKLCDEIVDSKDFCIEKFNKKRLGFVKTLNYSDFIFFNFFI